MASPRWIGRGRAVSQVTSWTFAGTWLVGETITVTYGTYSWTYTLASATIATFLAALDAAYDALASTDYPAHAEQTATSDATHLILTADTAGRPFTATISTNSASGTIDGAASSTGTNTTANAGPNSWATAANWSTGAVPVNSDTPHLDNSEDDIKYDLDQSAVTLTSLTTWDSFTGTLGLPELNKDGATYYAEYRPKFLAIGCTTCNIGMINPSGIAGSGSGRLKINFGSVQTLLNVYQTASGVDAGLEALLVKGTHTSNVFNVSGDSNVGVAVFGAEAAAIATLRVAAPASVRLGPGVSTLTNVQVNGGALEVNSAIGTGLTQIGGQTVINGTGAVAQLTVTGGEVLYLTSGTLGGNTVLMDRALLDFSGDDRAKTITNAIKAYGGANVNDPQKVVSSLIVNYYGEVPDVSGFGANVKITRAAVD